MIFLKAFLLGGMISLLFQLFFMFTKTDISKIVVGSIILGGLLTPLGVLPALVSWGGGGMFAMVMDAGETLYNIALMGVQGNWIVCGIMGASFVGLILSTMVVGIIGALAYLKIHPAPAASIPETKSL